MPTHVEECKGSRWMLLTAELQLQHFQYSSNNLEGKVFLNSVLAQRPYLPILSHWSLEYLCIRFRGTDIYFVMGVL